MTVSTDHAPEYLTPREAAQILRVSSRTLSRWEASGKVRASRLPNNYRRYRREDIEQLLAVS